WGVKWHQQPAWMIVCAFSGLCLAIGHHVYYSKLDHTPAGNEGRQQWAHTFGNIFAVSVATLFAVANRMAYKQYFWTIVRRKSFTLKALDSLFSLTSDLLGFLDTDLWKGSPLAVVLASICWAITFAVFLPPGSLTVTAGTATEVVNMSIPQLDWNSLSWADPIIRGHPPAPVIQKLVTQTSQTSKILDLIPPSPNSSYSLDVRGPYLKCEAPNSTYTPFLNYYLKTLYSVNQSATIPKVTENLPANFGRSMGYTPSFCTPLSNASQPGDTPECQMFPFQLWVMTSDDAMICTLGNGTRRTHINFLNGEQLVTYEDMKDFNSVFAARQLVLRHQVNGSVEETEVDYQVHSYKAVYLSVVNMISGNISMWIPWSSDTPPFLTEKNFALRTGLDACQEIANNVWGQNYTNDLFKKPEYMCRNRTLARAIEDLAANVTISMLASSELTSAGTNMTPVTVNLVQNIYIYKSFLLVISYGLALLFTIPGLVIGIWAFCTNGVSHSTSFSAILLTTRNMGLDEISEGHSLGVFPLDPDLGKTKLKFGGVQIEGKWNRAAFGRENEVLDLKVGNKY
ncbi:hypothetical protein DL95DRAFT_233747, partial [Leptodontidium sp. 2 PMI_412]